MLGVIKKFFHKYKAWMITHAAVPPLLFLLGYDPNNWKLLTPYSGYFSLAMLALVVSLNPLRKIFPTASFLRTLNLYRQQIGVACFSYAVIHILCFIIKRSDVLETLKYFLHPALIPVVFVAFPIFFLLALTSNKYSLKKLGFLKWKKLHKMVYWAEAAVFLHMLLVGQKLYAFLIFIPLVTLQSFSRKYTKKEPQGISKK